MAGDKVFPLTGVAASHSEESSSVGIALSTDLPFCKGNDYMSHG